MSTELINYDIHVSYHEASLSLVTDMIKLLSTKYIFCTIQEEIKLSKVFLAFITKKYCETATCLNAIKFANENKMPLIAVMLEEINIDDLGLVAFYIIDKKRCTAYKDLKSFKKLKGTQFDDLINVLNESLNKSDEKTKQVQQPVSIASAIIHSISSTTDLPDIIKNAEPLTDTVSSTEETEKTLKDDQKNQNVFEILFQNVTPKSNLLKDSTKKQFLKKIKNITQFKLNSMHFRRVALSPDKKCFLICDINNKSIMCVGLNGEFIKSFNPENILKGPCALCIDYKKNEIYVSDWTIDLIFVFNDQFKVLRVLGEMEKVDTAFDLCFDSDSKYLFASDSNNKVITVLNGKTGQIVKNLNIDSPKHMRTLNDTLYVLSDNNSKAYILGLDKYTFKETSLISLTNLGFVRGLHIDECSNIYTTAYEKDSNNNIMWDTAALYIYGLNNNGVLLNKIELGITGIWDIVVNEMRVYFILEKENTNYVFEFE
jgi:hypothetical protein